MSGRDALTRPTAMGPNLRPNGEGHGSKEHHRAIIDWGAEFETESKKPLPANYVWLDGGRQVGFGGDGRFGRSFPLRVVGRRRLTGVIIPEPPKRHQDSGSTVANVEPYAGFNPLLGTSAAPRVERCSLARKLLRAVEAEGGRGRRWEGSGMRALGAKGRTGDASSRTGATKNKRGGGGGPPKKRPLRRRHPWPSAVNASCDPGAMIDRCATEKRSWETAFAPLPRGRAEPEGREDQDQGRGWTRRRHQRNSPGMH